ncbi:MAG: beta-lactamase family protein [Butyrivibrio sp.]|nr:beta-lactamase family protein [Butyrivibrio sp.]
MFEFKKSLPYEEGVSSLSIKKALENLEENKIPMHSLLIMRHDKLIFEKYYAPYDANTLHRMFSITKSFTAMAISLLAAKGQISLDESITKYFPEYTDENTHEWIKQTTIRNMLEMRTCHAASTYKVNMASNWVESFFTIAPTHKPGTVFHYDTSAAHVMAALVEKLSGMKMLDYMKENFLKYLDFSKDSYIVEDPFGTSIGGSGLMATPMDILKVLYVLAKKGKVICNDGVERQLLDEGFTERATSKISDTIVTGPVLSEQQGYGMQIWQNEQGGFVLYGMGGQLAISLPKQDMLIMTTADTQGIGGGNQTIYKAIYDIILPALDSKEADDEKSDSEHAEYNELLSYADSLCIMPPKVAFQAINHDQEDYSSRDINNFYEIADNAQGFKRLRLITNVLENKGVLFLERDNGNVYNIPFGINNMIASEFPVYEQSCYTGSTWLSNNVLYIRSHIVDECVGSVHFELYLEKEDITVFMKKIEETYFGEFNSHLYGKLIKNN